MSGWLRPRAVRSRAQWILPLSGAMRWLSSHAAVRTCGSSTWRRRSRRATPRCPTAPTTRRPNGARWRLTGLPGPAARGAASDEAAITEPCTQRIAYNGETALSPCLEAGACTPTEKVKHAGAGRVLVFAYGVQSSGIPPDWAAGEERPGINFLAELTERESARIARQIRQVKRPGDLAVVSLHWGGNWGYAVAHEAVRFARRLIDEAAVDVLYGHSSHHPRGVEVYRGRLILYGCGDFIDDYEGVSGHERL